MPGMKRKPAASQKGLKKLPTAVRNKMGYMKAGGMAKKKMMGGGMPKKDHGKAGSYGKKMMGGGMMRSMYKDGGSLKAVPAGNKGLKKLKESNMSHYQLMLEMQK